MELQADLEYKQHGREEAKAEALRAVDVFEKLEAANDLEMQGTPPAEETNEPTIPDNLVW